MAPIIPRCALLADVRLNSTAAQIASFVLALAIRCTGNGRCDNGRRSFEARERISAGNDDRRSSAPGRYYFERGLSADRTLDSSEIQALFPQYLSPE